MFYYLYEIRNNINGKIYIGVHKTKDINDGYMGSGRSLKYAQKKYGIENFSKVILEMFNTSEDMFLKEKEIVTEEFLLRNDVYNLNTGGNGGFDYINKNSLNGFSNPSVARKGRESTNILMEKRYGKNWRTIIAKIASSMSNTFESKEKAKKTKIKNGTYGKTEHLNSETAILKKKETFKKNNHQSGINNSQYGKIWITDGTDSKSINKNDPIPIGWEKGRVLKNKKSPFSSKGKTSVL